MTISQMATKEKQQEVVNECADDHRCQEVLLFLERHPRTRFSRLAIIHALNGYKWGTEQALDRLTNAGAIKRCVEGNIPLYSLNGER